MTTTSDEGTNQVKKEDNERVGKVLEVEDIRNYLFKDAEMVNGLPEISMSELIKRTKELGFSSAINQGTSI